MGNDVESRSVVVASNYWHQPGVKVSFRHDEESPKGSCHVEIDVEDFLKALEAEMIHPLKTFTRRRRRSAIRAAYASAIEKIKQAAFKAL